MASLARGRRLARAIGRPLADSALCSSLLVLPALVFNTLGGPLSLALCLFWLAAIWLALAWRSRDALLFGAHQAALTAATLAATTAWLEHQGWIPGFRFQILAEPRTLQVYGIGLAALSLVWIVVRIAAGRIAAGRSTLVQRVVESPLSVDRVVRYAVVVAQWLLLAVYVLPGEVARELGGSFATTAPTMVHQAFGPAAWLLLAVFAAIAGAALWDRWDRADLVATLLVAATVPCLLAGPFLADRAAASMLRWGLAVAFVLLSIAVWQRHRLLTLCAKARTRIALGPEGPAIARIVLLATTALPVVGLTVLAVMIRLGGTLPGGPLASSRFAQLGPIVSGLIPLALVILGLVGFALRERSAGYAFSAGLVLELAVTLGYTLTTLTAKLPFDAFYYVKLLQLATVTAAAWACAWLLARRWLDVWREPPAPAAAAPVGNRVLMNVQLGMAGLGNLLLLGGALVLLVFASLGDQDWSIAAGLPLGWIALGLPLLAWGLRRRLRPQLVGLAGMAALGLLACTVRGLGENWRFNVDPIWGYRTLMLGWAAYSLLVVLATWWVASLRTVPGGEGPPQRLIRMAAVWVRAAGILAVLLGLKAAFWRVAGYQEELWAAAAIAVASGAGATMAVWRRAKAGPSRPPWESIWPPRWSSGTSSSSTRSTSGGCDWSRPMSSPARRSPWPGWRPADASINSAT